MANAGYLISLKPRSPNSEPELCESLMKQKKFTETVASFFPKWRSALPMTQFEFGLFPLLIAIRKVSMLDRLP